MRLPPAVLGLISVATFLLCVADARSQRALSAADSTQGGCRCPEQWVYKYNATSSVQLAGCANPDSDPKGDWCPVSKTCAGHYGNYTRLGETIHYDYCGAVRGTTQSGCICNAVSIGFTQTVTYKPTFDGCTSENSAEQPFCIPNLKTCKSKPKSGDGSYDFCKSLGDFRVEVIPPDGTNKTQAGCSCAKNWTYWVDDNHKLEPQTGCSYHDRDPKGSWCVVDREKCPHAYGFFQQSGPTSVRIYYDYCGLVTDFTRAGCRCKPIWGGGKLMDRCANPDGKPGGKWCEIMPGSCSKGKPEDPQWDYCTGSSSLVTKTSTPNSSAAGTQVTAAANSSSGATSSSAPSSSSSSSSTAGAEDVTVVAAPRKSDSDSGKPNLAVIISTALIGVAALVSCSYAFYKWRKKRQLVAKALAAAEAVSWEPQLIGHANKQTI